MLLPDIIDTDPPTLSPSVEPPDIFNDSPKPLLSPTRVAMEPLVVDPDPDTMPRSPPAPDSDDPDDKIL